MGRHGGNKREDAMRRNGDEEKGHALKWKGRL